MSGHISLTAENTFYGTQMKPDIYEPATAEWAGRAAMNAGWLFERQQQVLFSESKLESYHVETPEETLQQVFRRRFWLNEMFGTYSLRTNLTVPIEVVLSATLSYGFANMVWLPIGTAEGTYVSSGWKALAIHATEPNGWRTQNRAYGELCLYARVKSTTTCRLNYCSFLGLPRS